MALTISRYGEVSPTEIHSNGVAVSSPIYIILTTEKRNDLSIHLRIAHSSPFLLISLPTYLV